MSVVLANLTDNHLCHFEDASEWLAAQKYQVFETVCEDYIIRVSPPEVSETSWSIWNDADKAAGYGERLAAHKRYVSLTNNVCAGWSY